LWAISGIPKKKESGKGNPRRALDCEQAVEANLASQRGLVTGGPLGLPRSTSLEVLPLDVLPLDVLPLEAAVDGRAKVTRGGPAIGDAR
jgi:hypothetical protein